MAMEMCGASISTTTRCTVSPLVISHEAALGGSLHLSLSLPSPRPHPQKPPPNNNNNNNNNSTKTDPIITNHALPLNNRPPPPLLKTILPTTNTTSHTHLALTATAATAITAITALLLPRIHNDYLTYLSYGPGGTPHNVLGWLIATLARPFGSEMLSTEPYDRRILADGETKSYLAGKDLIRRQERPAMGWHVVPQRQLSDFASGNIREKLINGFTALAAQNPHLTKLAPSNLEAHADGLFVADGVVLPSARKQLLKGEIAHIHRMKDASVHVLLAPADCKKVFEAGWGQRHPLSGVGLPQALGGGVFVLPAEYVFVYAPRTGEGLVLVMDIVRAGVAYMTNSNEVH
ncbi:hypothetical protein P168DRAFT_284203 [Aspergillus campestris IBT 28561]|uniref:Luciferase domain-containing protein n=1 Tax=Aspergillus campestris (strain IBT 28561) TaxID=1392248 RepID=A0A2I1CV12_ASPC2|nr:uncharacterized protein P168DRAFT_284203 [Aspergillus campestris IBT 28561]PKY01444.1 hypothetical protein P168DRAFT_284203 [Aspergillus campestris IBT 28561]